MSFWPFFDLTVRTPRLELRGATDALLEKAAALHAAGIAWPGEEPIDGDASIYYASPEHEWRFLKGHWGARAKTSPEWWFTPFAIGNRPSGGAVMERYLLTHEAWERRRRDDIEIKGLEPVLAYLGLSDPPEH